MATETVQVPAAAPRALPLTALEATPEHRTSWLAGWREPWWKPAVGIPLYLLAGALVLGGLLSGLLPAIVQGLELLALGLLAADAWRMRQNLPLLGSANKRLALLGWLVVLAAALSLAIVVPIE